MRTRVNQALVHKTETLLCFGSTYIPASHLKATERQQAYDDMLDKQKEFAAMLYQQKDRDDYRYQG